MTETLTNTSETEMTTTPETIEEQKPLSETTVDEKAEELQMQESGEEESPDGDYIEDIQDGLSADDTSKPGDAISAIRKRYREEISQKDQEIEQLKRAQGVNNNSFNAQSGISYPEVLQDPLTGQYVSTSTPEGQVILQEHIKREREQQYVAHEQAREYEKQKQKCQAKLDEGELVYKNFSESREAVKEVASGPMAMALFESNKTCSIINYLGKNPKELAKFKELDPIGQMREVFRLEERLRPSRKLTSTASKPVENLNTSLNQGARVEDQSISARAEYYKKRFYGGR